MGEARVYQGDRLYSTYNTEFEIEVHTWTKPIATCHGHDFFEFAICDKGEYVHYKNDEEAVVIKKRQAVFLTPQDKHSLIIEKKGSSHMNISITQKLFFELCQYFDVSKNNVIFQNSTIELSEEEFRSFRKQVHCLFAIDQENEKKLYKMTLRRLAMDIFYSFYKREKEQNNIPEWLTTFTNKVCAPEFYEIRVTELYKYANYSQPIVTNAFKKYYGVTFVQYFTQKKMVYACGLLKNTDMGILEISNRCGFSSLSHFNRIFKNTLGITPSSFRGGNFL